MSGEVEQAAEPITDVNLPIHSLRDSGSGPELHSAGPTLTQSTTYQKDGASPCVLSIGAFVSNQCPVAIVSVSPGETSHSFSVLVTPLRQSCIILIP